MDLKEEIKETKEYLKYLEERLKEYKKYLQELINTKKNYAKQVKGFKKYLNKWILIKEKDRAEIFFIKGYSFDKLEVVCKCYMFYFYNNNIQANVIENTTYSVGEMLAKLSKSHKILSLKQFRKLLELYVDEMYGDILE